ncbi:acyltransferase family protein, partial [Vibrio vulnificus]|uniref:acyltransferase family protein n=2 Tax=Bacteria TaxID=2 RepID=UPI0039B54F1E
LKEWQSYQAAFFLTVNVPIFFALSGYLYHPQKVMKQVYKLVFNLLLPYFFTAFVIIFVSFVSNHVPHGATIMSIGSDKDTF